MLFQEPTFIKKKKFLAASIHQSQPAMANEHHTLSNSAEPLAIVGLSFKLPQDAVDETSFWEVMEKRKNLLTDWPTDRTCLDGFYQDGPKEPNMVCYCPEIKAAHINATILTQ